MNLFELPSDGVLPSKMTALYGNERTLKEHWKVPGVGGLQLLTEKSSPMALPDVTEIIRANFDWLQGGSVIRFRTLQKNFAVGFTDDEVDLIRLTKEPDSHRFMKEWHSLVSLAIMLLPKPFPRQMHFGPAAVEIRLKGNQIITMTLSGDRWHDCLRTFLHPRLRDKVTIVDKR